jgi:hypothetical protein
LKTACLVLAFGGKMDNCINLEIEHEKESQKEKRLRMYTIVLTAFLCFFGTGRPIVSIIVLVCYIPLIVHPEMMIGPIFFANIFSGYILVAEGQTLSRYLTLFFVIGVFEKGFQRAEFSVSG